MKFAIRQDDSAMLAAATLARLGAQRRATGGRPRHDRITLTAELSARVEAGGAVRFATPRAPEACVRHTGIIRPHRMNLAHLRGTADEVGAFSLRLVDRDGGGVKLAAHVIDYQRVCLGQSVIVRLRFVGLADRREPERAGGGGYRHAGAISGVLDLCGTTDRPERWSAHLRGTFHAAPPRDDDHRQRRTPDRPDQAHPAA